MDYGAPVGYRLATAHPERVSALLVHQLNPLYSAIRMERFREIPFVASFSPFMDETTSLADLILPDSSFLESLDIRAAGAIDSGRCRQAGERPPSQRSRRKAEENRKALEAAPQKPLSVSKKKGKAEWPCPKVARKPRPRTRSGNHTASGTAQRMPARIPDHRSNPPAC